MEKLRNLNVLDDETKRRQTHEQKAKNKLSTVKRSLATFTVY